MIQQASRFGDHRFKHYFGNNSTWRHRVLVYPILGDAQCNHLVKVGLLDLCLVKIPFVFNYK